MKLFKSRATEPEATQELLPQRVPSLGNGITVPVTAQDYEEHLEFLRTPSVIQATDDLFTDWMGVRTRISMLPWAPDNLIGTVSRALPIPDDGYRSEAEEYVALSIALRRASSQENGHFTIGEIGAGWAPWVVSGIKAARDRGLSASGVAVEAQRSHAMWAVQHARDNEIDVDFIEGDSTEILTRVAESIAPMVVVLAAAWHENTILEFPQNDDSDMGGAICTMADSGTDYRGAHLEHTPVTALALHDLLAALPYNVIDLLHVDVQGVEYELLNAEATAVQDYARLMAVGTHSRLNEGLLQDFFLERGWGLMIDEPCKANFTMTHPTLAGFTVQDGFQLYENPFLLPH